MSEAFPSEEINRDFRLEINIPARRLSLFKGGQVLKSYSIAVGSIGHKTPRGDRYLEDITWNPWWYPPTYSSWAKNAKPERPGPNNPLGPVKMSLGGDIKLHGTNKEWSIGHPASHGCIRMRNKDARELAWFFQRQFSDEADDHNLGKYARNRSQTYAVKLRQQIPVQIIYDRVNVDEENVEIFPDIYVMSPDKERVEKQVLGKLSLRGIQPWDVDFSKLEEIRSASDLKVPVSSLISPISFGL